MKKALAILFVLILLAAAFLFGWRVWPRLWPDVKQNVVYPVLPQMRPEPTQTPEPYVPRSDAAFGDPVSESDSLVYYFYKDYCGYCKALAPLIAGLPKQITLADGTVSDVKVVSLNKAEGSAFEAIAAYYDAYGVPEDRQYVPAVVIGDRYLFEDIEIVDQLIDALLAGEGLSTPLIDGNERVQ